MTGLARRFFPTLFSLMTVVALLIPACAWSQESSSITGTVTDPSGAVIPKAQVTATQDETGTAQSTVSNGDGIYQIPGLAVGHYTLTITAQGFETFKRTGIVVNAAQVMREDANLTVGTNAQTVTVQAAALQIQSESNEISTLISGQQVRDIATNGRNITSLTTLGTGVSWNGPSFNGVTAQNSVATISFNGLRPDHNNFLIDGGEVYDRGSGGKLDVLPSPDAIGQFQVMASNYPPDYGISSGGTVLVELKSGSQRFHGGVWEFNRNDDYDADYYFSKNVTPHVATPELRLNIFGGNIGGPVWFPHFYNDARNKTFFFVNEEWRKYIAGVNPSVTSTVPANDFPTGTGAFTYYPWNNGGAPIVPSVPNNGTYTAMEKGDGLTPGSPFPGNATTGYTVPANMLDANALLFMGTGAIPMPNSGSDSYTASPKQPTYVHEDVVRIDHNLTDKYHLMGSWIHDSMTQTIIPTQWSGDSYDTVGDVFANPSWAAAIRLTQSISPTVLNETGLYVNGNTISVSPYGTYAQPSGWNASSFFTGNNPDNRLPQVSFSGGPINTSWTVIYWPWKNSYLDYQIRDDLSWTKGRHAFKFGASYMREDKNQQLQADTEGDYSFSGSQYSGSSYLNFLLGLSNSYAQLQAQRTDYWLSNNYAAYVWDNWHLSPRVSVQLGLRYDALPHTYEKHNDVANFNPADYNPANAATFSSAGTICTSSTELGCTGASPGLSTVNGETFYLNGIEEAGVNGAPRGLVKNNYFTWQPRIGFAWDLLGSGKTVLRGGIGVFYERMQGNDIYNLDTTPPFAYQPSVNDVFFSSPQTSVDNGTAAAVPTGAAGLTDLSYYYPNPATMQFSLGVQQQLAPAVVGAVQYVGSGSWNQDDKIETNDLPLSALAEREEVATSCTGTAPPSAGANPCPNIKPTANLYRPFLGYSNVVQEQNSVNANYNSLQATLRMENRHGLTLQFAYTWSHEIDIQSADLTSANEAGTSSVSDPYNLRYDRGSGLFDRRNIFNVNYIYAEPFFKNGNAFTRTTLGGWQLAGVTVAESGSPQNIYYNGPDVLGLGGNAVSRPNIVSKVSFPRKQAQWFNTASFANPVAPWAGGGNNGFGSAGKDTIVAPGLFNWNMSLYKDIPFTAKSEGPRLQLRFESFNTFNHTEFNGIDTGTSDSNYGKVTSTYDPREFQFGGKILF
jgi:hypothetical protein